MTSRRFELVNAQQAHVAIQEAWLHAKGWLCAGGGALVLEIRLAKRSDEQNRLLHACLGEIARQKDWAGGKHDVETWKRLLTAAWLRARGESDADMLPALDGRGVDVIYRKTSKLNRAEFPSCASLCLLGLPRTKLNLRVCNETLPSLPKALHAPKNGAGGVQPGLRNQDGAGQRQKAPRG